MRVIATVALLVAAAAVFTSACDTTADCPSGSFCREAQSTEGNGCATEKVCVPFTEECGSCEGFTMACHFNRCNDETHFCSGAGNDPRIADAPGVCAPQNCSLACPAVFMPVCTSEGFSMSSECDVSAANCVRQKCGMPLLEVVCAGECPCTSQPPRSTVVPSTVTQTGPIETTYVPPETCSSNDDCRADQHCRPRADDNGCSTKKHCVDKTQECGRCGGEVLPCDYDQCASGLHCQYDQNEMDAPGKCVKDDECPTMCTEQYQPVCGSDGKTYGNPCFFQADTCAKNQCGGPAKKVTIACYGECPCKDEPEPCQDYEVCDQYGANDCSNSDVYKCVDDPRDDCDPHTDPIDPCPGICAPAEDNRKMCGGFGGFLCDTGYTCLDNPFDNCDVSHGAADCAGICIRCAKRERQITLPHRIKDTASSDDSEDEDGLNTGESVSIAGGSVLVAALAVFGWRHRRLRRMRDEEAHSLRHTPMVDDETPRETALA